MRGSGLTVRIVNGSSEARLPRKLLTDLMRTAYASKTAAAIDLAVLDDDEIRRLNRRHLGRDEATDVLAFDDGEAERGGRVRLGDVAISAETARREAERRGMRFEHELAFYALHGLFHLMGMRDDTPAQRAAMHKTQAAVMIALGLPAPDTEGPAE